MHERIVKVKAALRWKGQAINTAGSGRGFVEKFCNDSFQNEFVRTAKKRSSDLDEIALPGRLILDCNSGCRNNAAFDVLLFRPSAE
jgi:hypothetical protein